MFHNTFDDRKCIWSKPEVTVFKERALENQKKFGEWHKIIVDEQLPLKIFEKKKAHGGFRRGNTFQPEKVEDYWALLLEKVSFLGHRRSLKVI